MMVPTTDLEAAEACPDLAPAATDRRDEGRGVEKMW
jgi:hypothetical protein